VTITREHHRSRETDHAPTTHHDVRHPAILTRLHHHDKVIAVHDLGERRCSPSREKKRSNHRFVPGYPSAERRRSQGVNATSRLIEFDWLEVAMAEWTRGERERIEQLVAEGAPAWKLFQAVPHSRHAIRR
jgi:hypothetical protein